MAMNNNNNCNDDANTMVSDIYWMVIDKLKAASVVCSSAECTEYFNAVVHRVL
jgi:hypothetical protein